VVSAVMYFTQYLLPLLNVQMMLKNAHCVHSSHNSFFVVQKGYQWLSQLVDIEKLIKATPTHFIAEQNLVACILYRP
jgi:hypothetical protein